MNFSLNYIFCITYCFFFGLSNQCSNSGYPFENFLSTLTPYRIVSNKSFEKIEYEGCTPRKIWMIVRHGTRNPSFSDIEKIKKRLPKIGELILENDGLPNDYIRNRDLDLFESWNFNIDEKNGNKLRHEGEEEMLLLAERMQSRFTTLFDNVYSNSSFKFKYTLSQRTKKSAYYFVAGLFGKNTAKDVWFPTPLKKDPILRFYKLCTKWIKHIKNGPKTFLERDNFESSVKMNKTLREISIRLNLQNVLTIQDVVLMYKACSYETAWNKKSKSPWCSVFSQDNIKVLEYAEDLKYYWQDGYGHELTYKQACPAFSDMINFLKVDNTFPKATVYFTHSGTILKLLGHIGLYKEKEHLMSKNFQQMLNRKWRTSVIDSFGSNLAFVSFICGREKKVLTMHQEKIVRLPSCPDTDLCEIKKINNYYMPSVEHCDFSTMCTI